MKKLLFVLAIMPLLIVACSSDDDTSSTSDFDYPIETLYGEWRITDVEVDDVPVNLTTPQSELYVAPTYLKFEENGKLTGEGVLGEGNGEFGTRGKVVYTSIGKLKANFEVVTLSKTTAKIKLDAKHLSQLPLINKDKGILTVTLTKSNKPPVDSTTKKLFGKWRATSVEGVYEKPIDLTDPVIEQLIKPTYITFEEKGVFKAEGIMGEGTGRYVIKNKAIFTLIGKDKIDFNLITVDTKTARIEINPHEQDIDFGVEIQIPEEVTTVTVVLTKQTDK